MGIADRSWKSVLLCLIVAGLMPVDRADAQCVGGTPDSVADVSEDCDDGNTTTGDGCDNSCEIEPNWSAANAITFSSLALDINNYPGSPGASWSFAGDNSWASQDNNTGGPTVGLFGVDAMRGTYALELEVGPPPGFNDNDFIGVVLGFNENDPTNATADYLLIDWKQEDQGAGLEGLALNHVVGIPDSADFWGHDCDTVGVKCVAEIQRAADLGSTGWIDETPHVIHITYRSDRLLVMVDGAIQFDVSPSDFPGEFVGGVFPSGEIGFYSYSQEKSITRNIATIGASVLNTTTVSDGDVYVLTNSGTATVSVSDFFTDDDDSLNGGMILVTDSVAGATTDDPTGGAADGTIEVTALIDSVPGNYVVPYTACDDHPIVPHCDTATVTVHYVAPGCGNFVLEPGEACDDGNLLNGDGCSIGCLVEDDGDCTDNADCVNTCVDGTCGPTVGVGGICDASDDDDCTGTLECNGSGTCGGNGVGCSDNSDCVNTCIGGTCSDTSGTGGTCDASDDDDCTGASVCDGGSCEVCVNDAAGLGEDAGCNVDAPICATSSSAEPSTSSPGSQCRACLDDAAGESADFGCSGGTPFCDPSGSGTCAACVDASNCPGLQVCVAGPMCDYPDADQDGVTDQLDLDDDNDGIPDIVEGDGTDVSVDSDLDGVPDYADPEVVTCADVDPSDGVCDSLPEVVDADGDGVPNHLDRDSDGDGVPDSTEGHDENGDGAPDAVPSDNDNDNDGLDDAFDSDCAGMPAGCAADGADAPVQDTDDDGRPDYLDVDSDDDAIPDHTEAFDANLDGVPDVSRSGIDDNGNGLDDAFDTDEGGSGPAGGDTDSDGRPDYLDVDSDKDGIRDDVECPDPTVCPDTDRDGKPDYLDEDSDNDGILDVIEGHDLDGDGSADFSMLNADDDNDGLDDAYDEDMAGGVPAPLPDLDDDGKPDYQDSDDDGDGVGTVFECTDSLDCEDTDSDGKPDYLDADDAPDDTDGDGIPDVVECGGDVGSCPDTDGDTTPDYLDPDDDGDGIPTAIECGSTPTSCDSDDDGKSDHLDIDSDDDGITDSVECSGAGDCVDTDFDGIPDYLDPDSDDDGIPDFIEGHDADMDGLPDSEADDADSDGDGLDNAFDPDDAGTPAPIQDTDDDGTPDWRDSDDDDDGVDTQFECSVAESCPDGDNDDVPDYLDEDTVPNDTDTDGIPDVVECPPPGDPVGFPEACPDSDGDELPDFNDPDDDNDGIDTADENYDGDNDPTDQDSDRDGKPDYLDPDDDNDSIPTATECPDFSAGCADTDGDSRPDYLDVCGDGTVSSVDGVTTWEECDDGNATDGDGCASTCRLETAVPDTDGDGIPDNEECPPPASPLQPNTCPDSDDDGIPDFEDEDDDNDGIPTTDEDIDGDGDPRNDDTDGDSIPNYLDEDDDNDTIPTSQEISDATAAGLSDDVDGDGIPNWLDTDSDGDGLSDEDEAGTDFNEDGIPDYLQSQRFALRGGNFDCAVNHTDDAPHGLWWMLFLGALLWRRRRSGVTSRGRRGALVGFSVLLGLGAAGSATPAMAQFTAFDLNQFRPSERAEDGLAISTADDLGHLRFGAQMYIDYADDPLVFVDGIGGDARVVHQQLTGHLQLSFGLLDRLIVFAGLPYHFIVREASGDDFTLVNGFGVPTPSGSGLGDLWAGARVRVWGEREDVFQLAVQGALNFHTAAAARSGEAYRGDSSRTAVSGHPELLFTFNVLDARLRISGNLGYWIRENVNVGGFLTVGDALTYGAGILFAALDKQHKFDVLLEAFGRAGVSGGFADSDESPLELLAGGKYHHPSGFTTGVGVGLGVQNGYGSPDYRLLGMVAYTMPGDRGPGDADGDGLTDDVDQCPTDPEDIDGFEDDNGCPDTDNDQDGVLDVNDGAPNDPEDEDGFQDEDGVPDPDNDEDGIVDVEDRCPNDAGPPENRGCPDPDRDGDGVPDRVDNCPDEPGTIENQGCQDKQLVEIKEGRLEILEKVYFRTNSHRILPRSFPLLDNVAQVLDAHPEISLVRVEGHTDERGSAKYNLKLSDRRAKSVRRYLVNRGVAGERLQAEGFGEGRPVVPGATTADDHAQNRRVEFNIVE